MKREVVIYIDGSCKGNPGIGSALALFEVETNGATSKFNREETYEHTTNNRAEYGALLLALNELSEETDWLDGEKIDIKMNISIYTDSNLICEHLNKEWKVNKNHDLVEKAKFLLEKIRKKHNINVFWIPRNENKAGIVFEGRIKYKNFKQFKENSEVIKESLIQEFISLLIEKMGEK